MERRKKVMVRFEERPHREISSGWMWGVFIVLILALAAYFFGSRLVDGLAEWKATYHIHQARSMMAKKDWETAGQFIRQALTEDPKGHDGQRVLADYLEATTMDPGLLIETLRGLEEKGAGLPEDGLTVCSALLRKGEVQAAQTAFRKLPSELTKSRKGMEIEATLLRQKGEGEKAAVVEKQQAALPAVTAEDKLKRAVKDTRATLMDVQAAAVSRLWELAAVKDEVALQAIQELARRQDLTVVEAERLLEWVEAHPRRQSADRLGVLSALMRVDPARRAEIVETEVTRSEGQGLEASLPLANWLATEKEVDRLLKRWPLELAAQSQELMSIVAEALVGAQRWDTLRLLLAHGRRLSYSKDRLAVWQSMVSHYLDQDVNETRVQLQIAVRNSDPVRQAAVVLLAARFAEHLGFLDLAIEGYFALAVPGKPYVGEVLDTCWELACRSRETRQMLQVAEKMHTREPHSREVALRVSYLRLLMGENIETGGVADKAEALPAPLAAESDGARLNLALQAFRMGDLTKAASLAQEIQKPAEMPAGQRAVLAGVLAGSGKAARGYQLAEKIPAGLLSIEEGLFLKRAL